MSCFQRQRTLVSCMLLSGPCPLLLTWQCKQMPQPCDVPAQQRSLRLATSLLAFSTHMGQRCVVQNVRMNDTLFLCVRALSSERSAFRIQPSTWPQVCRTLTVRQLHYISLSRRSRGPRKPSLRVAASVSFHHSLARGIRSVFRTLTSVTT
jgi:hypothetical protein